MLPEFAALKRGGIEIGMNPQHAGRSKVASAILTPLGLDVGLERRAHIAK